MSYPTESSVSLVGRLCSFSHFLVIERGSHPDVQDINFSEQYCVPLGLSFLFH